MYQGYYEDFYARPKTTDLRQGQQYFNVYYERIRKSVIKRLN